MGRYISKTTIAGLGGANNPNINTTFWRLDEPMEEDVQSAASSLIASGNGSMIKDLDNRVHAHYSVVNDVYDEPMAILRVERLRTGYAQFEQGMQYMLIAFVVMALVFEALNFVLLDWFVLSRLKKLENQAEEIGKSDKRAGRVIIEDGGSGDEISHLAADINRMLSRLAKTQEELLHDQMNYGRRLHYEVKQKTHLLERANARLRHVEKMRNQFLFNIGHELKSPLAVIEMNKAAIISRTQDKSQHKESEAIIDRNMLRLKQKIEEIIQLSRFEQSRIVQKKEIDFCALVRETAEIYRDFARVKKAKIRLAGASRCAMVMGDRRLLLYALSNLFSNAVRYCDARGVYAKVERGGGNIVFSIANYGPSIKPKNRHKLFRRFFKEDLNAPGTGVGLFITREIVRGHGGSIWHKANRPRGAIFIFSIPANKEGELHETK
jgi:signal transduction histidine kinase